MLNTPIHTTKNLLAFSGGIDSTALFFLLLEQKIPFDIAIVNYNTRVQAQQEVAYAKSLAAKYSKQCFVKEVTLPSQSNFEKHARDIRYTFFEELIATYDYKSLITAHQLNDKLEWFLMQLSKGAGLKELLGLQEYEQRANYTLLRPLLQTSKEELLAYLNTHHITYFEDESNQDTQYKRNQFRLQYSNELIHQYKQGIQNSFEYLQKDLDSLDINYTPLISYQEFECFNVYYDDNYNIKIIDKNLKQRGFLLSHTQRNEILRQRDIVISHKIAIGITEHYIYIAPYTKSVMPKVFKEKCRVLKVPKNIRGYLYSKQFDLDCLAI